MFIGTQFMYPLLPVSTGSSISIADDTASKKETGQNPQHGAAFVFGWFTLLCHSSAKIYGQDDNTDGQENNGLRIVSAARQFRISRADVLSSLERRTGTPANEIPAGLWTLILPYTRMWSCAVGAAPGKTPIPTSQSYRRACAGCTTSGQSTWTLWVTLDWLPCTGNWVAEAGKGPKRLMIWDGSGEVSYQRGGRMETGRVGDGNE